MRAARRLLSRLLSLVRNDRDDREFADEIETLVAMHRDEHRRAGVPPVEAERRARLAVGSVPALVESRRDERSFPRVESLAQDLRHALRRLRQQPAFAIVCITMLGLGTGVTAVIFSFVHAVLLAPLPYARPDELVAIWTHNPAVQTELSAMSPANVLDLRAGATSLASLEAFQANIVPSVLRLQGSVVGVQVVLVTPGLFPMLGRESLVGRTFREDDASGTVVLSHAFWQRQFGGDPSIVGQTLREGSGRALTVVGVMPPEFGFPYASMLRASVSFTGSTDVDLWAAMPLPREPNRGSRLLGVVARQKPGVPLEQTRAEVGLAWQRLVAAFPDVNVGWETRVVPLHDQSVGPVRATLWLLLAGVGVVLLIACVNVAQLLLARGVSRQREMALRAALGAARGRLVQQWVVEGLTFSGLGTLLGIVSAWWMTPILVRWAPPATPRLNEVTTSVTVVLMSIALAVVTGLIVGLAPAISVRRESLTRALNDGGRGASDNRRRLRSALVAAEVAMAVILATGAGLLVRSFIAVLDVDPGFRSTDVVSLSLSVPDRYDTNSKRVTFYHQLFERLEHVPGVLSVGGTTRLPLAGANSSTTIAIEGREPAEGRWPEVDLRRAMHKYFDTMGIPVLRGRGFSDEDREGAPAVVAINQTLARLLFGDADPIGQRVKLGPTSPVRAATVIGIVGDLRHTRLETPPAPEVYVYYEQGPPVAPLIVVRAAGDLGALGATLRVAVREVDAQLSPFNIRTMAELRSAAVRERRFLMSLISAFGVLALTLAALGVYGVMMLVVVEGRRDMSLRLALGARPRRLMASVVGKAMSSAAIGAGAGLAVALALTPAMASQLFGVAPTDPLTVASVLTTLMIVALVASWIPARGVLRVDPIATLRGD